MAPAVLRAPMTAVSDVLPDTTTLVAATPPMVTVASLEKPVPVIVTLLPPVVLPLAGEMADTFTVLDVGPDGEPEPQAAASRSGNGENDATGDAESMQLHHDARFSSPMGPTSRSANTAS